MIKGLVEDFKSLFVECAHEVFTECIEKHVVRFYGLFAGAAENVDLVL